jgi:uncharacterized cupin superfamily protein
MNRSHVRLIACVAILGISAFAALASTGAGAHAGGKAVLIPSADLKWVDVKEFPGVKMAVLQGDPGKGASHFFMKLPGGFSAPLHFHDADHWVAVVSGTLVLTPEGGTETQLPPGSGFSFTGKKNHTTMCAAGADCVLFIDSRGKWDVVPVSKK